MSGPQRDDEQTPETTGGTAMDYQDLYTPEDERWERRWQLRDWMILAAMIAATVAWHLVVFFLEPGLR